MKLSELKQLAKDHNIKGGTRLNKLKIISLLGEKGILSEEEVETENRLRLEMEERTMRRKAERGDIDPKYERLKTIRNNAKRVRVRDIETGEVVEYPSIYKTGKAYGVCARTIDLRNGKLLRKRYEIKILDPPKLDVEEIVESV